MPEAAREEIAGVAEAVDVPETWLFAFNLDAALFPAHTAGCTQGVRMGEATGEMVHFVNEDSPLLLHLRRALPRVVLRRRPQGAPAEIISFSLAGQIAGINAARGDGLTLTSTTLLDGAPEGVQRDGWPHPFVVQHGVGDGARPRAHPGDHPERAADRLVERAPLRRRPGSSPLPRVRRPHILRDEALEAGRVTTNHALDTRPVLPPTPYIAEPEPRPSSKSARSRFAMRKPSCATSTTSSAGARSTTPR